MAGLRDNDFIKYDERHHFLKNLRLKGLQLANDAKKLSSKRIFSSGTADFQPCSTAEVVSQNTQSCPVKVFNVHAVDVRTVQ